MKENETERQERGESTVERESDRETEKREKEERRVRQDDS